MKKNILNLILVLYTFITLLNSCQKPCCVDRVYSITIKNNYKDTIQIFSSYNYPDTSLSGEKPRLKMVYPNNFSRIDSKDKWEEVLPKDVIIIYILDKDTVDTYSWEKIRDEYKILKRFDLSIEDLENSNWIITYP